MSMSRKKCCVPGCMESGGSHRTLHLFPNPATDRERFSKWVFAIGGDILGLKDYDIYQHRSVCHAHFEENFCCRNNRLSNIAVPTLNLPGSLSLPIFTFEERRPMRQIQNYSTSPPVTASSASFVPPDLYSEPQTELIKENKDPTMKQPEKSLPTFNKTSLVLASTSASLAVPSSEELMPENKGSLSLPIFTFEEKRPMRQIQNYSTSPPVTASSASFVPPDLYSEPQRYELMKENKDPAMKQPEKSLPTFNKTSLVLASTSASLAVPSSEELMPENKDCHKTGIVTKTVKQHVRVTPAEQQLYHKLLRTRVKLSKCRNKIKKQVASPKAAKTITSNLSLRTTIENLPSATKLITLMQFREGKKKEKGRRFSLQEKILALSIFKQAPKGYRFLRKILILPAPQTLSKLISSADIRPGINEKILSQIKKKHRKNARISETLCTFI